jgi:hypothetical protein
MLAPKASCLSLPAAPGGRVIPSRSCVRRTDHDRRHLGHSYRSPEKRGREGYHQWVVYARARYCLASNTGRGVGRARITALFGGQRSAGSTCPFNAGASSELFARGRSTVISRTPLVAVRKQRKLRRIYRFVAVRDRLVLVQCPQENEERSFASFAVDGRRPQVRGRHALTRARARVKRRTLRAPANADHSSPLQSCNYSLNLRGAPHTTSSRRDPALIKPFRELTE